MKTQVGLAINQQQMWGLGRVSAMLPVAITLLLTGCLVTPTSTPISETGHASSNSASPTHLTRSEQPSAPARSRNQSSTSPATATKNTTDDQEAVRQAVLNDPSLNAALRQEFERVPGRQREHLHPLEAGAIAIVENYALADVSGGVGDLPVIDGYYLLKKQSGQWIVVGSVSVGGEIAINRMASLGLSESTIQGLLKALQAIGANFTVID
ncbi:MAG: hypothetical protein K6T90_14530 [Leptolyngbyaceae cyanobacterium HOT.MB2.61]|nr:hypothetical protein [Leptolyngbyaceae cyanobacterium HOT.MB2.61]